MKLKVLLMLALFVICMPSLRAQGRILAYLISDADSMVNIRKDASDNSTIVSKESIGKAVYISPGKGGWYKISLLASKTFIGYVHWMNVAVWSPSYGEYEELSQYIVTDPDGYVNVRKDTNSRSSIVRRLNKGTHFLGKTAVNTENWIGVFDNRGFLIGYVYTERVRKLDRILPFGVD